MLYVTLAYSANQFLFSQNSSDLSISPIPTETITIVKPVTTQNVSAGQELTISGLSSDNTLKNCSVSVIVNDVRPYQIATAKGTAGINDYSQWEFVLRNNYTQIIEGENKITSKLYCTSAAPRWYSVFVNGVPNTSNKDVFSPVRPEEQQNTPTTNLSETSNTGVQPEEQQNTPATNLSQTSNTGVQPEEQQNTPTTNLSQTSNTGVQPEEQQNTPTTNLSQTSDVGVNNKVLRISISPLKNPIERGDSQSTTITVTDSDSRPVANAEISGVLIYPGDNYKKEFSGITDFQGKFVYSWIIGKKGDVGPLSIELEVSSQGFPPSSATGSFDVIDSS